MFYHDVCPTCEQQARYEGRRSESDEPEGYETHGDMTLENEPGQEMDRLADPAQITRTEVPVSSSKTSSALRTFLMSPQTMSMAGGH
jgi:hypothetical protein